MTGLQPLRVFIAGSLGWFGTATTLPASEVKAAEEARIRVSKSTGVYTRPPDTVGVLDPAIKAYRIPDGPLMGHGDIAVAVGGTDTSQTFYLSKSNLSRSVRGLVGLTYSFGGAAADVAGDRQEQDLYRAEVRSVIPLRRTTIRMRSWTADHGNVLVTDLTTVGEAKGSDSSRCVRAVEAEFLGL